MTTVLLRRIGRLFTGVDVRIEAAVVVDGPHIAWVGDDGVAPPSALAARISEEVDVGGALVTPGLIDAHTHPVYARPRLAEVAARSAGEAYGGRGDEGGIGATVRDTRATDPAVLEDLVARRMRRWLAAGTTTVEAKTGYHLDRDGELGAVRLLDRLRGGDGLPDLVVTFLGAHAPPPGRGGGAAVLDAYAAEVASWCADARRAGADACDVFCDQGFFSVEQARTVLTSARGMGLRLRVHADELERTGGARLAAELEADSADHLLCATPDDARALAAAGVAATLCPGTALSLGRLPDTEGLRDTGVTLALGSDHNPGTCGITGMPLVVALAVSVLGLPVIEALRAATAGGAASLHLDDRGAVEPGRRADLVCWDADHEGAFAWEWGPRPVRVWRGGVTT